MDNLIKKTFTDAVTQFLIDNGKDLADLSNPISACKLALEKIEENNENKFIEQVLNDLKNVNVESLNAVKSFERLYKITQVIAKATTNEKIERFRKLAVNGIIKQDKLSDNDYELYIRLIDELTDEEYLFLYELVKNINKKDNQIENWDNSKQIINNYRIFLKNIGKMLNWNNERIFFIENSLAKIGLINMQGAIGGIVFKNVSSISYQFIEFINNQENNNA